MHTICIIIINPYTIILLKDRVLKKSQNSIHIDSTLYIHDFFTTLPLSNIIVYGFVSAHLSKIEGKENGNYTDYIIISHCKCLLYT